MFAGVPFAGSLFAGLLLIGEPPPPFVLVERPAQIHLGVVTQGVALLVTTAHPPLEAGGLRVRLQVGRKDGAR